VLGGGVTGAGLIGTKAFSTASADRGVSLRTADDSNAIVRLDIEDPVQTGSRTRLVGITNNTSGTLTYTVSLVDVTTGTLYSPDGGSGSFVDVTIASGETKAIEIEPATDSGGNEISFDISVDSTDFEFNATRSTFAEGVDYSDPSNYRDDDGGGAIQPTDPSGDIQNPGAVNEQDDSSATAISSGGNEDLKVGYALAAVDNTASPYEIRFDIERTQIGGGSFGFYLTNGSGLQLTTRQVLSTGENTYPFSNPENQDIAANADDLYLIIDSQTNGRGNRELDLDYFELRSA
jgi:hypothetical protein